VTKKKGRDKGKQRGEKRPHERQGFGGRNLERRGYPKEKKKTEIPLIKIKTTVKGEGGLWNA